MRPHATGTILILTALAAAPMVLEAQTQTPEPPPKARVAEVTDDYFGTKLVDPYRWMETGGDELTKWLASQGAYTERRLASLPGRERLAARVHELSLGAGRVTIDAMAGPYRFYSKIAAGEQLRKLVVVGAD